jgi:hypothetical protein
MLISVKVFFWPSKQGNRVGAAPVFIVFFDGRYLICSLRRMLGLAVP